MTIITNLSNSKDLTKYDFNATMKEVLQDISGNGFQLVNVIYQVWEGELEITFNVIPEFGLDFDSDINNCKAVLRENTLISEVDRHDIAERFCQTYQYFDSSKFDKYFA